MLTYMLVALTEIQRNLTDARCNRLLKILHYSNAWLTMAATERHIVQGQ